MGGVIQGEWVHWLVLWGISCVGGARDWLSALQRANLPPCQHSHRCAALKPALHPRAPNATSRVTSPHLPSPHLPSPHLTSRHVTSRHVTSRHVTSRHVTSRHVTSRHLTSPHLTSPPLALRRLASPHLTSPHVTSPPLTPPHPHPPPHPPHTTTLLAGAIAENMHDPCMCAGEGNLFCPTQFRILCGVQPRAAALADLGGDVFYVGAGADEQPRVVLPSLY